eukprot:TRINITY_DN1469_c0_g1_i1.p1 TRINITY_DN1469_c0_g1~~TRINITY_DN1469_c0_g1_i1.p1  ORF type:complete len:100 (+),score=22.43 TRINITY_DN1469_c0_g1_i1:134-433(+)
MNSDAPDPRRTTGGMRRVSKRMFIAGFFLLPWVWFVNFFYFYKYLKYNKTPKEVKQYVWLSLIFGIITTVLMFVWYFVFYFGYNTWGITGENLIIFLPK